MISGNYFYMKYTVTSNTTITFFNFNKMVLHIHVKYCKNCYYVFKSYKDSIIYAM